MMDWQKLNQSSSPYTGGITTPGITTPPFYPYPQRPSCFESKCNSCPFKDECKNKK